MREKRVDGWARQAASRVRFEWGLAGADAIAGEVDIAVVVDVLSFTTTLSVALDAGTVVLPCRWKDGPAVTYAAEHDAVLAVSRGEAGPGDISLSPQSIRDAPPVARLVLPSPNGSTICHHLASGGTVVLGASLRNADAVAGWIAARHDAATTTLAVIAAGEHWPSGGLRPAVEDLWGAGAVLHRLHALGWTGMSPEAEVARDAFAAVRDRLPERLRACASGRELTGHGFAGDVGIAAEIDRSRSVPLLDGHGFMPAPGTEGRKAP